MHPLGIDLGTTYSAISKWTRTVAFTGSKPYNIPLENKETLPSKVFLEAGDNGDVSYIVGTMALKEGIKNPEQLITAVKREIRDANKIYDILGQNITPIDVSAEILKYLLKVAEAVEGPNTYVPGGVVVTVPYYFKQHENVNTFEAGLKAIREIYSGRSKNGTDNLMLGLLAEPIAAGLAYAFDRDGGDVEENILVFDLGGGTFDVTVFSLIQSGTEISFKVRGVDGDSQLGGEDFDKSFFEWLCEKENIDLDSLDEKKKKNALKRILPSITQIKEELAAVRSTDLLIPNAIGAQHIELEVRRQDFEKCLTGEEGLKRDFFSEVESKLMRVLNKASLDPAQVDWVLMVGGSSKIPLFRQLIIDTFGAEKCKDAAGVSVSVTKGAAIYAAYLLDEKAKENGGKSEHLDLWEKIVVEEVTAHQLGIVLNGKFKVFLADNLLTPCKKVRVYEPTKIENGVAILDDLDIAQGDKSKWEIVGNISLDNIYTHGRKKDDISIRITFTAHRNIVDVEVFVKQGNKDKTDYIKKGKLTLKKDDE